MINQYKVVKDFENLEVPKEKVALLFNENGKLKKNYHHSLCSLMSEKFKCPFNITNKNEYKSSVSIYLQCIIKKEKKFKVTCKTSEISYENNLSMSILSNNEELCSTHDGSSRGRNLSHEKRKEMQMLMKVQTASQVCF